MNVGSLLARHARYRPNHVALVCEPDRLTFSQLNERVNRLANGLHSRGLKKGDKVALVLPNCVELILAYLASARMGLVVVPLSPLLRGPGLQTLLADSESSALITCEAMLGIVNDIRATLPNIPQENYVLTDADYDGFTSFRKLLTESSANEPPAVSIDDDDIYNIIYSSGTTGQPKGIIHTHYVRGLYCTLFANSYRYTPESVVLHGGSLVFNGAFVTLLPAWLTGCTYILMKRFDADEWMRTVSREKVTHVMVVPSQVSAILASPTFREGCLETLEMMCSVGAPFHREYKEKLLRMLPGSMYELYGLTEGFVTVLDRTDFAKKIDSVGIPIPFSDMRIVDAERRNLPAGEVGEIIGRGPLMMPGYYKRDDLTKQALLDGWLYTGDMGFIDSDGFLHLVDRKKDLIISGGVNVFPKDIEELAVQHPGVRDVAVFGIPSEKWGEAPVAAVLLKPSSATTAEELRDWINTRVAARYQQVQQVIIMDDFPRSAAGKTLKREMRDPYWAEKNAAL